jgi:hypothetical protein
VQKVHDAQEEVARQNFANHPNASNAEPQTVSTANMSTESPNGNEKRKSQTLDSTGPIEFSLHEDPSGLKCSPSETNIHEERKEREIDAMGEEPHDRICPGGWKPKDSNLEPQKRFSLHSQNADPPMTNEPVSSFPAVEDGQPSQLSLEIRPENAGSNKHLGGNVQQRQVSELKLENDSLSQPSTKYTPSSSETALNPSTAPESPLRRGNMRSLMERLPERASDNTLNNDFLSQSGKDVITPGSLSPGIANDANLLLIQQEARAEIRARKRGKAPKLRRMKLDQSKASENVDMTPAPGASEHWTYDPSAKGHYHIDSDTGSTNWYSDSDSEDSDN